MKPIALMFHDVLSDSCTKSGFQKPGARQYLLNSDKFKSIIESALQTTSNVLFTFDDGGVSFIQVIAPILEHFNQKGIFFITTSRIGTPGFLSEKQIVDLSNRGHIIASHSHTHPLDISKLSYDVIVDEWTKSKNRLERITGIPITYASVPGGAVSKKVIKAMIQSGYSEIYTSKPTDRSYSVADVNVIGRYSITNSSTPLYVEKLLSDKKLRKLLIVKYNVLRICKKCLGSHYNILKQYILKHSE